MLSYVRAGILALEDEAALTAFSGASAFATHCVLGDYDHSEDANSSAQNIRLAAKTGDCHTPGLWYST